MSAQGLGCMGMTWAYGAGDEQSGKATIDRALELGITFLDTADSYNEWHNEALVGRAIRDRRERVFLASKFGRGIGDEVVHRFQERLGRLLPACDGRLLALRVEIQGACPAHAALSARPAHWR